MNRFMSVASAAVVKSAVVTAAVVGSTVLAGSTALAQPDPGRAPSSQPASTQPASDRKDDRKDARREARFEGRPLERVRGILDELDLTKDQKTKIDSLFAETRDSLRAGAADRDELRQTLQGFRGKLMEILTPEQKKTVASKMQEAMRPGNGPGNGGNASGNANGGGGRKRLIGGEADTMKDEQMAGGTMAGGSMADAKMGDDLKMGGDMTGGGSAANGKAKEAVAPKMNQHPIAEVGSAAPDFTAKRLDGTPLKLANFKNHPVLMVFGSYSSPTFRDKSAQLMELARDYRGRVDVFVIYTAEAYPATPGAGEKGAIERNKDDHVAVEAAKSETDRLAEAKTTKIALKLDGVQLAVDDMNDTIAKAYTNTPNAAVVIGKDGRIAARQNWADPVSLRSMLEDALKSGLTGQVNETAP